MQDVLVDKIHTGYYNNKAKNIALRMRGEKEKWQKSELKKAKA